MRTWTMIYDESSYLCHHGIKGQKWGIRRYQNLDGSYTEEGKKRYGIGENGKMSASGTARYYKDYTVAVGKEYDEKHGNPEEPSAKYLQEKARFIRDSYAETGRDFEADRKAYLLQKEKNAKIGRNIAIGTVAAIGTTAAVGATISGVNTLVTAKRVSIDNPTARDGGTGMFYYGKGIKNVMAEDEDFTVGAGNKIYRMTNNKDDKDEDREFTYVNTEKRTAKVYKQNLGDMATGDFKKYERVTKANKDLKIAGGKTIINEIKKIYPEMDDDSVAELAARMNGNVVIRGKTEFSDIQEAVVKSLKEQGYSGMQDYNDKGLWGKGMTILFDQKENTDSSQEKIKKITFIDRIINGLTLDAYTYEEVMKK